MNGASLVAQRLKCLPAMRETWVQSLGREDPLKKEMAANSSILAWKIPWSEDRHMYPHFAKIPTFWELEDNKKIEGKA